MGTVTPTSKLEYKLRKNLELDNVTLCHSFRNSFVQPGWATLVSLPVFSTSMASGINAAPSEHSAYVRYVQYKIMGPKICEDEYHNGTHGCFEGIMTV